MVEGDGIADRIQREYGDLTYRIIGAAMAVHKALGPGFPEDIYQKALTIELGRQGIGFEQERAVEVFYDDVKLGNFYLDFLIENCIVMELKAVEQLSSHHQQQVISYLAASGREVALLINFGTTRLEYKRVFPPRAIQRSDAYQSRLQAWQRQVGRESAGSAQSADYE